VYDGLEIQGFDIRCLPRAQRTSITHGVNLAHVTTENIGLYWEM